MDPILKIGLGAAQWGMDYGISNTTGTTSKDELALLLASATSYGINLIDTASLYGESERAIGEQDVNFFKVITKTPRFSKEIITRADSDYLRNTFEVSLKKLGVHSVYGLMIHNAKDILSPGGQFLVDEILLLKAQGLVKKIGLSIYTSVDLDRIYDCLKPEIVQLPLNVLDQRLIKDGTITYLRQKGVEIHIRSVFLQGLLLMPLNKIPPYFLSWRQELLAWHEACMDQMMTPLQAALNYVSNIKGVDRYILGFENSMQLRGCVDEFLKPGKFDGIGLSSSDANLLNPANWRLV